MAEVKLTKTCLRQEQVKLDRLTQYLPTLQLKKSLLQVEVNAAESAVEYLIAEFALAQERVGKFASLLTDKSALDLFAAVKVEKVLFSLENIAGIEVPLFTEVLFSTSTYSLFATPLWFDSAISSIKNLIILREKTRLAQKRRDALEKELRNVSIRVNLFEKILIPRAAKNITKIKIFLGDQQLAAVCQAKVAKKKIVLRQEKQESA